MKLSDELKEILSVFDNWESSIGYYRKEVEAENARYQDYLHEIEFTNNCKARSRLATKQHNNLLHRRECKDMLTVLEPLVDVLQTKEWRKVRNHFSQALGKIRKEEQWIEEREYKHRFKEGD